MKAKPSKVKTSEKSAPPSKVGPVGRVEPGIQICGPNLSYVFDAAWIENMIEIKIVKDNGRLFIRTIHQPRVKCPYCNQDMPNQPGVIHQSFYFQKALKQK